MRKTALALALMVLAAKAPATAQNFPTPDPVLRAIWAEGMERSQAMTLIQVLTDSIGPRLTGTPQSLSGQEWLKKIYAGWGITARSEQYGTWMGWKRGPSSVDLLSPRVRSLEGTVLAWSPGTKGKPVQGSTIILADPGDSVAFAAWLPTVKGRIVLASAPEITCRPDSSYRQWAGPASFEAMVRERSALRASWQRRSLGFGAAAKALAKRLEDAGAAGVLTSSWAGGWGVTRIFQAQTKSVPTYGLSCEDYGLVFRLTERGQGATVRLNADAEFLGEIPVFNVIAEIKGSEKPDEYVMLSAHYDSWDGGSGATDNATGTITMLEAMRILKRTYPAPRRTLLVGHWNSEENGLIGSRAFAEDHPEIVKGLQALFNQDNGTGKIVNISATGLIDAGANIARWVSRLPGAISGELNLSFPGVPAGGGSDNASFACYGAPGFGLGSENADYGTFTWHTGRDTYDKVIADNLRRNATLTAMLAYLAAEDPVTVSRDRRLMPVGQNGAQQEWPVCVKPARKSADSSR